MGNTTGAAFGVIYVDIKGSVYGAAALEFSDFEASGGQFQVATMSYPGSNGTWSTGALNATGLATINKTGKTQVRVYFAGDDDNDTANDYLGFYSGDDATATNRPELVVVYQ